MAKYSSKDIQVLEGLEPVRKSPGMQIGSTSSTGLHHLLWEILDNSVDEALNGHCDNIEITLDTNQAINNNIEKCANNWLCRNKIYDSAENTSNVGPWAPYIKTTTKRTKEHQKQSNKYIKMQPNIDLTSI